MSSWDAKRQVLAAPPPLIFHNTHSEPGDPASQGHFSIYQCLSGSFLYFKVFARSRKGIFPLSMPLGQYSVLYHLRNLQKCTFRLLMPLGLFCTLQSQLCTNRHFSLGEVQKHSPKGINKGDSAFWEIAIEAIRRAKRAGEISGVFMVRKQWNKAN